MEKNSEKINRFGLLGRNISYSFSRGYFADKFARLGLEDHSYENFDIAEISEFPELLNQQTNLRGLNVTIPYKEVIIPYLQDLDQEAREIGAVNTLCFFESGVKGYNTDVIGFRESLRPLLLPHDQKALILGTGGASKAVAYALKSLNIQATYVSRTPMAGQLSYSDLKSGMLSEYSLIINCTPTGTYPNTDSSPEVPYGQLEPKHLLYDLIYNPELTTFLKEGQIRGTRIKNGLEMLQIQAEAAWKLWNNLE